MSYVMTSVELADKAKEIVTKYKTAYLLGTFGWPATEANLQRAIKSNTTNANRPVWQSRAKELIGKNGFYFDCCGLIKGILWGWNGNKTASYGGGKYASNNVPDIGADYLIKKCPNGGSTDFKNIVIGECVWMPGHIGIYIGNGLVVEATPAWTGGVQISLCTNVVSSKAGYNSRKRRWTKHGKLPYVDYEGWKNTVIKPVTESKPSGTSDKDIEDAIVKINKAGVIVTPEYWVANHTKLKNLDALIVKSASKIQKKGPRCSTPEEAIDKLVKSDVISDGAYWKANYKKLKYVDEFLCKIGDCEYK